MEQKYGLSYVAELKNELIAAKESGFLTRDVTAESQQNQRIIEETELPTKATGRDDAEGNPVLEETELENPADQVNGSRAKGVLLLVTEQNQHISEQSINPARFSAHREGKQEGIGLTSREQVKTAEKLLFDARETRWNGKVVEGCQQKKLYAGTNSEELERYRETEV